MFKNRSGSVSQSSRLTETDSKMYARDGDAMHVQKLGCCVPALTDINLDRCILTVISNLVSGIAI